MKGGVVVDLDLVKMRHASNSLIVISTVIRIGRFYLEVVCLVGGTGRGKEGREVSKGGPNQSIGQRRRGHNGLGGQPARFLPAMAADC